MGNRIEDAYAGPYMPVKGSGSSGVQGPGLNCVNLPHIEVLDLCCLLNRAFNFGFHQGMADAELLRKPIKKRKMR